MSAKLSEAQDFLRRALAQEPTLTASGICPGVVEDKPALREVAICIAWLRKVPITRRLCPFANSYRLKHEVEAWAGTYVSNGALIAAALGLGLQYRRVGPNALLPLGRGRPAPAVTP
jgi:hypothetical protein